MTAPSEQEILHRFRAAMAEDGFTAPRLRIGEWFPRGPKRQRYEPYKVAGWPCVIMSPWPGDDEEAASYRRACELVYRGEHGE